jgi:hypothetical protein
LLITTVNRGFDFGKAGWSDFAIEKDNGTMDTHSYSIHAITPSLQAMDSRGKTVRSVAWHRLAVGQDPELRCERYEFDTAGRQTQQWDARLSGKAEARATLSNVHTLSGQVLGRTSVDSGWQVNLPDPRHDAFLGVSNKKPHPPPADGDTQKAGGALQRFY